MIEIDLIRVRVGIEIEGQMTFYENMKIKATGKKFTDPTQNEAEVTISGLNERTRNFILTETSPYTKKSKPSRLTIEAGRVKDGLFLVFNGDIISSNVGMPPDLDLTIKAKTNNSNFAKVVITNGKAQQKLSEIAKIIANNNGLNLNFLAKDKNIANYSYSGTASKQIKDLQDVGNVNAFVDDKDLIIKDVSSPVKGRRRILNMNSGLVGIPKQTETGAEITYLINDNSLLGGQITLESKFNKPLNGDYVIENLSFNIENEGNNFFYIANCRRLNVKS